MLLVCFWYVLVCFGNVFGMLCHVLGNVFGAGCNSVVVVVPWICSWRCVLARYNCLLCVCLLLRVVVHLILMIFLIFPFPAPPSLCLAMGGLSSPLWTAAAFAVSGFQDFRARLQQLQRGVEQIGRGEVSVPRYGDDIEIPIPWVMLKELSRHAVTHANNDVFTNHRTRERYRAWNKT